MGGVCICVCGINITCIVVRLTEKELAVHSTKNTCTKDLYIADCIINFTAHYMIRIHGYCTILFISIS